MKVNRFLIFLLMPPFCIHAADTDMYDMVLASAPVEVQALPDVLKDPKERADYPYNCMALVGPPGVGKTTMAHAVAHKAGWDACFISNGHLSDKYRNASSRKLQDMFEGVVLGGEKTVVILDEFNAMVENYDSANHDTDALSRTIWSFLDDQQDNNNLFVIATMNRINKIPVEMKERLLGTVVQVDNLKDVPRMKMCFLKHMLSDNLTISDEIKPYIAEKFAKLEINNPRRIAKCAQIIKRYALDRTKERPVELTRALVDCGFDKYKRNVGIMDFDRKDISDEERRFQAAQELQRSQFRWNLGFSVTGLAVQSGIAVYQICQNKEQFGQTMAMHGAGLFANFLQMARTAKQFQLQQEFQERQMTEQRDMHQQTMTMQKEHAQAQQDMHNQNMAHQQGQAQAQQDMHSQGMSQQREMHQQSLNAQQQQFEQSHELAQKSHDAQQEQLTLSKANTGMGAVGLIGGAIKTFL